MKTRNAEPDDAQALHDLAAGTSEAAKWTLSSYSRALESAQSNVVVAEEHTGNEKEIVGFIVATFTRAECEIENLAVRSDHRRKGIASTLLRAVISDAQECGIDRVLLEVRESNVPAITFYLKAGFTRAGRRTRYYANPEEDALLLAKRLQ